MVRRRVRHIQIIHSFPHTLLTGFPLSRRILSAIDAGSDAGGASGRLWTIDPIDGTLGFLRKEQYAVCLALIVDGKVELGLLACPNLGTNSVDDENKGILFLARKGEGSWSVRPRIHIPCTYPYLPIPASDPSTRTNTQNYPSQPPSHHHPSDSSNPSSLRTLRTVSKLGSARFSACPKTRA